MYVSLRLSVSLCFSLSPSPSSSQTLSLSPSPSHYISLQSTALTSHVSSLRRPFSRVLVRIKTLLSSHLQGYIHILILKKTKVFWRIPYTFQTPRTRKQWFEKRNLIIKAKTVERRERNDKERRKNKKLIIIEEEGAKEKERENKEKQYGKESQGESDREKERLDLNKRNRTTRDQYAPYVSNKDL